MQTQSGWMGAGPIKLQKHKRTNFHSNWNDKCWSLSPSLSCVHLYCYCVQRRNRMNEFSFRFRSRLNVVRHKDVYREMCYMWQLMAKFCSKFCICFHLRMSLTTFLKFINRQNQVDFIENRRVIIGSSFCVDNFDLKHMFLLTSIQSITLLCAEFYLSYFGIYKIRFYISEVEYFYFHLIARL